MENELDENLLARFFEGTTSEIENKFIENWTKENDNNQKLSQFKQIWQIKNLKGSAFEPDIDLAWEKVQKRINRNIVPQKSIFFKLRYLGIAASVLLLTFAGIYFFDKSDSPVLQSLSTKDNSMKLELADGSKVSLNKRSKLQFPESFDGKTRVVKLKGEAFFDIKRDESKPFIIEANDLNIKVLGTSFNVETTSKTVKVSVKTGMVEVRKSDDKFVILHEGEEANYNSNFDSLSHKIITDFNVFSHHNKVFIFKNTNLKEVVNTLNNGYQVNIRLENERMGYLKLTTKFENESLDKVLAIITEALLLDVKKTNNTYLFSKRGN